MLRSHKILIKERGLTGNLNMVEWILHSKESHLECDWMFGEGNKKRTEKHREIEGALWRQNGQTAKARKEMWRGGPRKLTMLRSLYVSYSWLYQRRSKRALQPLASCRILMISLWAQTKGSETKTEECWYQCHHACICAATRIFSPKETFFFFLNKGK